MIIAHAKQEFLTTVLLAKASKYNNSELLQMLFENVHSFMNRNEERSLVSIAIFGSDLICSIKPIIPESSARVLEDSFFVFLSKL